MKNSERIHSSLRLLDQYMDELTRIFPDSDDEYYESLIIRRSSERQMQIIIEQVTDICALLYRHACLGIAGDDTKILDSLSETCLSPEICEKIRRMKGFRNVLVHGYAKLDNSLVYFNILSGKDDISQFIEEVAQYIERQ